MAVSQVSQIYHADSRGFLVSPALGGWQVGSQVSQIHHADGTEGVKKILHHELLKNWVLDICQLVKKV